MPLAGAAGVNTRAGAKHKQEMSKRWADRAAKLQVPEKVPFDFSASRWNYVERLEAPKPSRVSWHVRSQWNANSSTGSVSRSRRVPAAPSPPRSVFAVGSPLISAARTARIFDAVPLPFGR